MAAKRSSWLPLYAVIALLIAVFVAPSVDAAVCAIEAPVAAAHMADDHATQDENDDDDAGERGGSHGLCSHGHCHHGGFGRIDSNPEPVTIVVTGARAPLVDDSLVSYASEGLKRPPRG